MATNTFKQQVDSIIQSRHLLQHPFYIAWTEGKLTREQLRHYAEQYFYNVLAELPISAQFTSIPRISIMWKIV